MSVTPQRSLGPLDLTLGAQSFLLEVNGISRPVPQRLQARVGQPVVERMNTHVCCRHGGVVCAD